MNKTIAQVRNLFGRDRNQVELNSDVVARLDRYVYAIAQPEQERRSEVVVRIEPSGSFRTHFSDAKPVEVAVPAPTKVEKPGWMIRKLQQIRAESPEYAYAYQTVE